MLKEVLQAVYSHAYEVFHSHDAVESDETQGQEGEEEVEKVFAASEVMKKIRAVVLYELYSTLIYE